MAVVVVAAAVKAVWAREGEGGVGGWVWLRVV